MTHSTRRRFLRIATATAAVGVAGCAGGDDDTAGTDDAMNEQTTEMMDDGMTDSMDDGMTESGMDDDMTDSEMDDGMTESGDDMTEADDGEMTEAGDGEMTEAMGGTETFTVTVRNVSEPGTITTSAGDDVAVPLSPTAYAVHGEDVSAFEEGESASDGLEALAEDGMPGEFVAELEMADGVSAAGAVATPDGADEAGPIAPGETYTFDVEAGPDQRLTLATMFVQSNDLFYASDPAGIPLFDDGDAVNGDVTDQFDLWDAGTEANQEPGAGADQAPRQSNADTGPDEDGTVRTVSQVMDDYEYPDATDVIEVTVSTM